MLNRQVRDIAPFWPHPVQTLVTSRGRRPDFSQLLRHYTDMKSLTKAALLAALLAFSAPVSTLPAFSATVINGIASWYGPGFHGRTTASGERFNTNQMTAAHKSLPFGTTVRVTNLSNGRSVVVRINDRGPYHGSRVIDLSHAAAVQIGMIQAGTANVKIEVLA